MSDGSMTVSPRRYKILGMGFYYVEYIECYPVISECHPAKRVRFYLEKLNRKVRKICKYVLKK